MSPSPSPVLFDRARIARNRDRASHRFEDYAFLKVRESNQLLDRLRDSPRSFEHALDFWAHTGQASQALLEGGSVKKVTALEPSAALREKLEELPIEAHGFGEGQLPYEPQTFDLIASVLALHWINDLPGLLEQFRTILKPDGLLLACLFGGGTLRELRSCLIEAESEILGGVSPRLSPLPSLQDMAGLLQRARFALPVADVEHVTVRYEHPLSLLKDLKGMGEQAAFALRPGQERRPLSRRILARMSEIYQDKYSEPDGRVRATFEIIWLSGWAPAAGQPKPLKPGSGKFSLASAVKKAGKSTGED